MSGLDVHVQEYVNPHIFNPCSAEPGYVLPLQTV